MAHDQVWWNNSFTILRTGFDCIDTISCLPVSNLSKRVLNVLAVAALDRRTIGVKAKMPDVQTLISLNKTLL